MADPRLQLRRGTQSPAAANVTTALAGEPFFDTTNDNLWIADGASSFVNIGGASYTSRIDNFLTAHTGTVSAIVKIGDADNSAQVSLTTPAALTASYTLTLPSNDGDNGQFLTTDGSGALSWTSPAASTFTIAGDTGTDTFATGQTLTFAGTDPIDTTITDNTVTISAKDATTTTKGVASFSATDFTVTAGAVSINAESIQDTVGAMVSTNTENGIAVTYDDTNGKLDFDVADFTITLTGDVTGTGTVTNLGNVSFAATIAANSVALGTDTTGQYASTITGGVGIAATAAGADDGTAYTIDLDINELTAESAIADADTFAFYDATATANRKATADNLRDYVLGGVSGDITISATGVATIAANSVALGTDTTGNYVGDVTAGAGLTKSSTASEGQTVDLAVGAGEGIVVNADDVALKNGTNLADATVMGWDNTNNQLTNAPITYSGNNVSITGDLTVTGNDIKSSGGTTAITLSGADVTIAGNLTVSGTSTILNTETLSVEDRLIELGLINGAAPSAATTWDLAVAFNYHATTAKKSAIVWMDNAGFELASTITETAGAGSADPQITVSTFAPLGVASLYIGSIGTSTNEVITSAKQVVNVTIDCGTY